MSWDENNEDDAREEERWDHLYETIGPEWAKDHVKEIVRENYDFATQRFTEERLKSYYLQHPDVAAPAVRAVEYAETLMPAHPAAALVFAGTSVELTWKSAILKPLVSGVVHVEELAEAIVERAVPKAGRLTQLNHFLSAVLRLTADIDLSTYKRANSTDLLQYEINDIACSRNNVFIWVSPPTSPLQDAPSRLQKACYWSCCRNLCFP